MKIAIVNLITRSPLAHGTIPTISSNKDAMVVKFAYSLAREGFNVDIFVSDAYKPVKEEHLDVNLLYLPTVWATILRPGLLPFTPGLFLLLRNRYEVIITSEIFQLGTMLAVIAGIFSTKKKPKIIVWQEMSRYQRFFRRIPAIIYYRFFWRLFFKNYVWRYVPRGKLAYDFLLRQGIPRHLVSEPIPHGIDENIFFADPSVKRGNYFFSPCRHIFSKGVDVLLRGFAHARENSRTMSDVRLLIQGDGPLLEENKRLAEELGIIDYVEFATKHIDHVTMRKLYQSAIATVISSRFDLMIFSPMESLICGIPVIISSGVDIHYNFKDNKGGIIFPSENHLELARLLTRIANDNTYRQQLVQGALEKAPTYYNKSVVKHFTDLINHALQEN